HALSSESRPTKPNTPKVTSGPDLKAVPFSKTDGIRTEVHEALTKANITHPTVIQHQSLKALMGGRDVLLAAET
ncbi:hypothetical protein SARC_15985, partial [Sphaeroforma arctica JP610]